MIINQENYRSTAVGAKAKNLFRLMEHSFFVPPFFCVPEPFCDEEVLSYIEQHFPDSCLYSVRSCASVEDSSSHSFAGQFQTFLRVERSSVCDRIREVLAGLRKEHIFDYCKIHGIDPSSIRLHVIVQEMIEADTSGVLFTANPQGILNETVIVLGAGTGDQVVEDRTDTTACYYNLTDHIYYYEQTGNAPLPNDACIQELIRTSQQVKRIFSMECDMEYAWKDGKLWLLQVRPITTLGDQEPIIILDNSNIVESYPGITLPLTQSFIKDAYHQVFRTLLFRLTRQPDTIRRMDPVLCHMVDTVNGRVYYRISNWYDVLLLLPFHKKLIPIWQEMMGVRVRTVSSSHTGPVRWTARLKTAWSFCCLLFSCPRKMKRLDVYFAELLQEFDALDTAHMDTPELLSAYRALKDRTVARWDITLVNDMYAFLFTGLLKARLKAGHIPEPDLAANRAIRGIRRLDSLEPIRELLLLAEQARKEERLEDLRKLHSNEDYEKYRTDHAGPFIKQAEAYIRRFGDRNLEELKLESRTFRTDPILLIRRIVQYADHPPAAPESDFADENIRSDPLPWSARFLARRAALGIQNRERSRLNRSRLYGMMRTLVLQMGNDLQEKGRICRPEDIFYLRCEEIRQAAEDPALDVQSVIRFRKEQYEGFATLPAYSRLVFSGKVTDKQPQNVRRTSGSGSKTAYTGTACSQGIAEGKVLVIRHPARQTDTENRILVTKMTDPGWVFLIAGAKAVVSEKGSLLSHTAIISRELGKPAVVGIPHITEELEDGDLVRVDGNTGTVTVLCRNRANT